MSPTGWDGVGGVDTVLHSHYFRNTPKVFIICFNKNEKTQSSLFKMFILSLPFRYGPGAHE